MPVPEETASRRETLRLVVRKTIAATPERLFAAWTKPEQLKQWWGPQGVICIAAAVDLRVGGRYRIGNRLPDGRGVWITGEYRVVEPATRLVYSWHSDSTTQVPVIVTVAFQRRPKSPAG